MNGIFATLLAPAGAWHLWRRSGRLHRYDETTHLPGGMICCQSPPRSGRWRSWLTEALTRDFLVVSMAVNQWFTNLFEVSCCTLWILLLCVDHLSSMDSVFKCMSYLSFEDLNGDECCFTSLFIHFLGSALMAFRRLPSVLFVIHEVWTALQWFAIIVNLQYCIYRLH